MKLVIREVPGAVVVNVRGKLIGGSENCEKFRGLIESLLHEEKKKIIVNLRETPWANSQGVGLLIGAHRCVTNAGGELILAHVIDRIYDILSVTRILLMFETFDTEDQALEYLTENEYGAARIALAN